MNDGVAPCARRHYLQRGGDRRDCCVIPHEDVEIGFWVRRIATTSPHERDLVTFVRTCGPVGCKAVLTRSVVQDNVNPEPFIRIIPAADRIRAACGQEFGGLNSQPIHVEGCC